MTLNPGANYEMEIKEEIYVKEETLDIDCENVQTTYEIENCGEQIAFTKPFEKYSTQHQPLQQWSQPYQCCQCGINFLTKGNFENHKGHHCGKKPNATHTGDKPYRCSLCGKDFFQSDTLRIHLKTHNVVTPSKCDKGFPQNRSIKSHSNTRILPCQKPHKCNQCDKSFKWNNSLIKHMLTHSRESQTEEKTYQCKQCDKAFYNKSNFYSHLRTHSWDKPRA